MPPRRTLQRGEIYWVDFEPTKGHEQGGKRLALVIQNDVGNRYSPTTIVAVVTRSIPDQLYPFMVLVEPADSGLAERGVVNCAQIRTISTDPAGHRLLLRRGETETGPIGRLGPAKMAEVDLALHRSLAAGRRVDDTLQSYLSLTREDILAAIADAAQLTREPVVPLATPSR
jgi:mRNA interferase MazF